jgi:hypothetical protein
MARLYLSASDTKDGKYQKEIDEICKEIGFENEDKGARLRAIIDYAYQMRVLKSSQPMSEPQSSTPVSETPKDLDHLNINDPKGAIAKWLQNRELREAKRAERAKDAFAIEQARQVAKTKGEKDRVEIREEERLARRVGVNTSSKPKVDWGNSEGIDPDYYDGYR